ncbi:MAG: cardiolipin synthase [Phycisphaerales bacterium]|nr:cardiolipin synthase [Phycisphaerales bacterium]
MIEASLDLLLLAGHIGLIVWMLIEILLRKEGTSDTRLAWITLIVLVPYLGALVYMLFGGRWIGKRRRALHHAAHEHVDLMQRRVSAVLEEQQPSIPPQFRPIFDIASAVGDTDALGGNSLQLFGQGDGFAAQVVADITAATSSVHVLTYIFLDDDTGRRFADALIAAAQRGVDVRLLVDAVGSKRMLRSTLPAAMRQAGVQVHEMLPASPLRVAFARMDLRNHRKIMVIDNAIGWAGSRNIASPAFAVKAAFAPWVDCMVRITGPAIDDLQRLFLEDWFLATDEEHPEFLQSAAHSTAGCTDLQVIGTGPDCGIDTLHQILRTCFHAARDELILTTPYYVPDAATELALRNAAMRGVRTVLIVPRRNDSKLVSLASRSHYADLIRAGVEIHEFEAGLLHAKTMVVDREVFMIGSANLDRRSLELNFEVSLLGCCSQFASELRFLQMSYLNDSTPVDTATWLAQPWPRRLICNAAGLLSPLL